MPRITENTIEEFAIELLERMGYQYIYAPDIGSDSDSSLSGVERRNSYEEILLRERLQNAITWASAPLSPRLKRRSKRWSKWRLSGAETRTEMG